MFFFFFADGDTAADAFKKATKAEGITYDQAAKRLGLSRGTITKFVGGRPLSPELLHKIVKGFPAEHGKRILIGHLNDEVRRAGLNPDQFHVVEKTQHTFVLENLARLLTEDPKRQADLIKLITDWESGNTKERKATKS